jgi:hypothetical protein
MTVAARTPELRPAMIDVFTLRAEARAILYEACVYTLHEAVDVLQVDAERTGLVAGLGQDHVQRILHAFHAVRNVQRQENPAPAPSVAPRQDRLPISTIRAAEFLVQLGDRHRLHEWLAKHTRAERKALRKHFARKKRRNG